MTRLRAATPDEAPALSALALASKAHWGYCAEFLDACRAELTVHASACDGVRVVVADEDGSPVGFYRLGEGTLDDLFVAPSHLGRGLGARLLAHARRTARALGEEHLLVDADPHAEGFYTRHGAVRVGTVASGSVAGRTLPQLRLTTG